MRRSDADEIATTSGQVRFRLKPWGGGALAANLRWGGFRHGCKGMGHPAAAAGGTTIP
jgi:hypothetical protein